MKRISLILMAMGLLLSIETANAHHSFTATYDESRTIEIEGTLVQFMFRNPHSWVHLMAPDEDGEMQRWAVEWGGASLLGNQGFNRSTLRPGDKVIITGIPGRNPIDHRLNMRTLDRPADGLSWGRREGEVFD